MPDLTNTRRGIVLILLATPGIVLMNTCAKVSSLSYVRSKWSFPRACSAECAGALYAANAAPVGFQTPTLLTHPAALIGLAAAVCVALVDISLRKLGQTDEPLTTVFYFILIGVLMTAPFVLVAGQRLEGRLVPWLILSGLFAALQAGRPRRRPIVWRMPHCFRPIPVPRLYGRFWPSGFCGRTFPPRPLSPARRSSSAATCLSSGARPSEARPRNPPPSPQPGCLGRYHPSRLDLTVRAAAPRVFHLIEVDARFGGLLRGSYSSGEGTSFCIDGEISIPRARRSALQSRQAGPVNHIYRRTAI